MNDVVAATLDTSPLRRTIVRRIGIGLVGMFLSDCGLIAFIGWVDSQRLFGTSWVESISEMAMMIALGKLSGQLMLVVTFTAFGDGSSFRRILYTTFTFIVFTFGLGLFCLWWLQAEFDRMILFLLMLLLMYFVFQIPLWGIRAYFGWMIHSPWSERRARRPRRYSLAHLLGWSAFLAVPLCILQVFANDPNGSIGAGALVFCFWAVLVSLLAMWVSYATLAERTTVGWSVFVTMIILTCAAALEIWVMSIGRGRPTFFGREMMMVTTANLSAGFTAFAVFRLAYRVGFRLLPFAAAQRTASQ